MKTIFNRDTLKFEVLDENKEYNPYYLALIADEERSDKALVVTLVGKNFELPLNDEDDSDTFKAVKLFKEQNIDFLKFLDFYKEDNPIIFEELENRH